MRGGEGDGEREKDIVWVLLFILPIIWVQIQRVIYGVLYSRRKYILCIFE